MKEKIILQPEFGRSVHRGDDGDTPTVRRGRGTTGVPTPIANENEGRRVDAGLRCPAAD
jgi:hypothetical protein